MCTLSTVHIAHGARWQLCTLHTAHAAHRTQSTLYLVNIATHCTTRALHTLYTRDSAWQTLLGAGDLQPPPSTSRFWFGSTGAPYDWGPVRLLEATEAPILAQQYKTTFRFGSHGSPHFGSLLKDDLWEVVKRPGRRPSKKKTTFQKKKTTFGKRRPLGFGRSCLTSSLAFCLFFCRQAVAGQKNTWR